MNAEFLKKLEEACLKNSIDIIENWGEELILMYRGTTFNLQCWEEGDELNTSLTVTEVIVKGKTFDHQTYPFIDRDLSGESSNNIDDVIYEIIEAILDCDLRQNVVKLVNLWDSFIEDIPLEEQEMLKSYIKYKL